MLTQAVAFYARLIALCYLLLPLYISTTQTTTPATSTAIVVVAALLTLSVYTAHAHSHHSLLVVVHRHHDDVEKSLHRTIIADRGGVSRALKVLRTIKFTAHCTHARRKGRGGSIVVSCCDYRQILCRYHVVEVQQSGTARAQ